MTKDEFYMGKALEEAKSAAAKGEVPIGAVIIYKKKTVAHDYFATIKSIILLI